MTKFKVKGQSYVQWPDKNQEVVIKLVGSQFVFGQYLGNGTFKEGWEECEVFNKNDVLWWAKIPDEWLEED